MSGPALAESTVMGRAPVLVLSSLTGLVGVLRLFGVEVSAIVASLGGQAFDLIWATALVASTGLILLAWALRNEQDRAVVEIGGLILHVAATLFYLVALVIATAPRLGEALFIIAFLGASVVNCTGRAWLLYRRVRWVQEVVR